MKGIVVSRAGDKTVVIEVTYVTRHPLYKRKVVRTRRFMVHDGENKAQIGQEVVAMSSRPLSARKRWIIQSYGS